MEEFVHLEGGYGITYSLIQCCKIGILFGMNLRANNLTFGEKRNQAGKVHNQLYSLGLHRIEFLSQRINVVR